MNSLRHLINLVERTLLTESTLSKGSQTILKNAKLVSSLADTVRDDAAANVGMTGLFPAGFSRTAQKMSDQQVAEWFLDKLDKLEQEGYGGAQYSRDGVNNLWIVNRYIAGSHDYEDITGKIQMNLSKWYFLKNRGMLDANHTDIQKFSGVRDLAQYIVFHYDQVLKDYEEKMKAQALRKLIRAFVVVDNNDYKIYATLNRSSNVLYGLGTTWCTASSSSANSHFDSYSNRAILFQLNPKETREVKLKKGDRLIQGKERFQFDAGGPNFMDIADNSANKEEIKKNFPYLYDDLVNGLKSQKSEIENYIQACQEDPSLKNPDGRVKTYNIDDEIKKLDRLVAAGWMTEKKRPAPKPDEAENTEQLPPPENT